MLKPQDLFIALKLAALRVDEQIRQSAVEQRVAQIQSSDLEHLDEALRDIDLAPPREWTHRSIAEATGVSVSEVNAAIQRALRCGLIRKGARSGRPIPANDALLEFIVHGVKYVYPAERGEPARGIPTGFAAPLLARELAVGDELPPVWPYAAGSSRGYSLSPLYKSAAFAAARDPILYELLVLLDVFRTGRQREKAIAHRLLKDRLT